MWIVVTIAVVIIVLLVGVVVVLVLKLKKQTPQGQDEKTELDRDFADVDAIIGEDGAGTGAVEPDADEQAATI